MRQGEAYERGLEIPHIQVRTIRDGAQRVDLIGTGPRHQELQMSRRTQRTLVQGRLRSRP